MRIVGILIFAIGAWGFFRPEQLVAIIIGSFNRNSTPVSPVSSGRLVVVRIIAALWAMVGLIVLYKG